MKTIKFYAIISAVVFLATSCVESSDKYKAAMAQIDSLSIEKQALDSNYNQTLIILNDIENGFSEINDSQGEMWVNLQGAEGKQVSKREMIADQMTQLKANIDKNKAKLAELQQLASKSGRANKVLTETIKRLETQMAEKDAQIKSLQAELESKNIRINELNTTVSTQTKNIAEQQNVMDQQKTTIKGQDADINTVWYVIAASKELKAANVVTSGGLFQAKKVMAKEFDKKAFVQVDLRNLKSIPTYSRKVKIMSSHPLSSYKLEEGDDKNVTIVITNPSQFWSVSKYLVVQI